MLTGSSSFHLHFGSCEGLPRIQVVIDIALMSTL